MGKRAWRWLALIVVAALVAASCGDDGDTNESAASGGTGGGSGGSDGGAEGEPARGGEATLLFWAEQASLDPVLANPTSGSTGVRDFALYGALVGQDPETLEVEPILAESLEPNATFDTWTLTLRPDLVFSDGTPFTADDVEAHWARVKDPANRSPAAGFAAAITSMTVVDELTLEVALDAPNSVFDRLVGRSALNYVPSADAVASGKDLSSEPVGAGPFVLRSWVRDDRMILDRNDKWFDAPRPYLDTLTIRVITDEDQRLDTLLTGDGDASYTIMAATAQRGQDEGASFEGIQVGIGSTINFNNAKPPFDDPDMRRAFTIAVDRQKMIEAADGAGAIAPDNYAVEGTPWHSADSAVPPHDPEEAQRLIDEYLERTGQESIQVRFVTTQSPRNMALGKFFQAAMLQLDGVEVVHEPGDQPTLLQKAFSQDFDMLSWGFPTTVPDPDLFQGIYSKSAANSMGYASPVVDGWFAEARTLGDVGRRNEIYKQLFVQLGEDLPFIPMSHSTNGWVVVDGFHLGDMYYDGIIRTDLAWVEG